MFRAYIKSLVYKDTTQRLVHNTSIGRGPNLGPIIREVQKLLLVNPLYLLIVLAAVVAVGTILVLRSFRVFVREYLEDIADDIDRYVDEKELD
jgi:hypothetical protein